MARRARRLPPIATGLRGAFRQGYGLEALRHDLMAGLTLGTVAVPLSMALAIATGVPPQHGLYTAIVAGALIALTGGSRFNVSGPTAAFVVILFPIVQQHGLGGLLIATMMAGGILVALGLARLGRLIEFVPYPVILGFTAGIAVVIATLQLPDFLGLGLEGLDDHFLANLGRIVGALGSWNPWELGVGLFTLLVMLLWPRLGFPLPAPLVGLVAATLLTRALGAWLGGDIEIATIASRFNWEAAGQSGAGIPPIAPTLLPPGLFSGADGEPLSLDFELFHELLGPAIAIAMLGAIESLLCAVVADGLTRSRHDPDAELIGQGLGNLVAPLFGAITATAALARTATNIRSGARSPLAAVVHALVVLLAVVALAEVLGGVPMSALAALLLIVAWNMSEARHMVHTLRTAPPGDVLILVLCFVLTVLFDMVLAVAVGIGLAAALFVHRMAGLTRSRRILAPTEALGDLPEDIALYDIDGPLFFAAADKALITLHRVDPQVRTLLLDMRDVPSLDATAIEALRRLIDEMHHRQIGLVLVGLPARLLLKLKRAGLRKRPGFLHYSRELSQARRVAERWREARDDADH